MLSLKKSRMHYSSNFVSLKVQRFVLDLIEDSLKFKVQPNITSGVIVFTVVIDSQIRPMTYNLVGSAINIHCILQKLCVKEVMISLKLKAFSP